MRVTGIRLENFRSFVDSGLIQLGKINVLIGANNSGKSSVLRGLHQMQNGLSDLFADVRVGTTEARIEIGLEDGGTGNNWNLDVNSEPFKFMMVLQTTDRHSGNSQSHLTLSSGIRHGNVTLQGMEPDHFIVPYLSKRKSVGYQEDVREGYVRTIAPNVSYLAAKLSRLGNPAFPAHSQYAVACKSILGFVVTAIPSGNGQKPGVYIDNTQTLSIEQLGEGVPNIVHFLSTLAVSEGKLFLVEEPENDLHPQALKALLDLVIDSAGRNQFVVSTHSNIVVRHLCSVPGSHLYRVRTKSKADEFPVESEIELIPNSPDARLAVLSELGYSLSDFELWDGWLVLEESSAERLIRDYLVPWFIPALSRMRTISAAGVTKVDATFEDLNRLFLFTHLTPAYRKASWVLVDGDKAGKDLVEKMRKSYSDYPNDRFQTFSKPAFEHYYPRVFEEKVKEVLAIDQKEKRREEKRRLLLEVLNWLDADVERGKGALRESAMEVISFLNGIQGSLKDREA